MGESSDGAGWRPRTDLELLDDQLAALTAWHERRRSQAEVVELRGLNREYRLDLQRRRMVRSRQQEALLARSAAQLAEGEDVLRRRTPRAVVALRRPWVRDRVAGELSRRGVDVLALLDDGADAVGVAVAEQPDLVLVEQALPTMSGVEVVTALREFCAHARLTAQVEDTAQVQALVAAGAVRTFPRATPPAQIAEDLARLVGAR